MCCVSRCLIYAGLSAVTFFGGRRLFAIGPYEGLYLKREKISFFLIVACSRRDRMGEAPVFVLMVPGLKFCVVQVLSARSR